MLFFLSVPGEANHLHVLRVWWVRADKVEGSPVIFLSCCIMVYPGVPIEICISLFLLKSTSCQLLMGRQIIRQGHVFMCVRGIVIFNVFEVL